VVQNPSIPTIPTRSALLLALVAILLASAVSVGVVFAIDYADQSFRTPSEVMAELRIPVLAAVPVHAEDGALYASGNGHRNGNGNGHGHGHHGGDLTFDASSGEVIEERG